MSRYERMWHDLRERIESARRAPLTDEAERILRWVDNEFDLVWNDHRSELDE